MFHDEYVRMVPGADTAVLFLHGIVGTPRHFDSRLPLVEIVPENWSVYSLLLPGHGGSVDAFSAFNMDDWKKYVWKTFDRLASTHQKVILVGHSMGTLFSIQLAIEKGDRIPFLFLIAVPICPQVGMEAVKHSVGIIYPNLHGDPKIHRAMNAASGVQPTKKLWKYIPWIPNFLDLLGEARKTKNLLPQLHTKTIVFQSKDDELVSRRSERYLSECQSVELSVLADSTHFYYTGAEIRMVQQAFMKACNEVKNEQT